MTADGEHPAELPALPGHSAALAPDPDADLHPITGRQAAGEDCLRCGHRLGASFALDGWCNALTGDPLPVRSCLTCADPDELPDALAAVTFAEVRVCVLCERDAVDPVQISRVDHSSGPGWAGYACQSCAEGERRTPIDPAPAPAGL